MKREEAISLIKQVVAVYRGTLSEHQTLQEAVKTLEQENETKSIKKDK